jgi:phage tail sheath protein FI
MPGVVVSTATRSGPSTALRAPSGQFFLSGLTERGDTDAPTLVRSMADVDIYLGSRVTYGAVWDQLKTFFDEGGQQAYVARVVGGAATKGTITLDDRAGAPVDTLRIDAQNEGAWSANLTVEVQDGASPNTFRIILRLDGDIVGDFNNLTAPSDAVAAMATSPFARAVDLGSVTAAPNNRPAVMAATALSAGTDDRAAVVAAGYTAALAQFTPGYGDGAVAIPGQTGSTVWGAIITHCEANNRIALLAGIINETEANLKTQAATLDSEYAGLFAPWVVVSDGGTGTRTISPEGFVAACRARAHERIGPWGVPAGLMGKANSVLDLAQDFNSDSGNALNEAKVSVIRKIAGTVRLYGWRSLSSDVAGYRFLKDRDLMNRLVVEAEKRLEQFVFAAIDSKGKLLSSVNAELVGMVEPIKVAGGLYPRLDSDGNEIDPGYAVDTSNAVNTALTLADNEIRAALQVRVSPTSELVTLSIVKVGILTGF